MGNLFFGKWFGIPLYLHSTWLIFFIVFLVANINLAVMFALVFMIIFCHEMGHCFATQFYGYNVDKIVIYPIGGVAYSEISSVPKEEIVIALAGPFVNFIFIPIFYLLSYNYPELTTFSFLFDVNLGLMLFNLVVCFPLDGGRVLYAVLKLFNVKNSLLITVWISHVFCILIAAYGIYSYNINLVIIPIFLWLYSNAALEAKNEGFTI